MSWHKGQSLPFASDHDGNFTSSITYQQHLWNNKSVQLGPDGSCGVLKTCQCQCSTNQDLFIFLKHLPDMWLCCWAHNDALISDHKYWPSIMSHYFYSNQFRSNILAAAIQITIIIILLICFCFFLKVLKHITSAWALFLCRGRRLPTTMLCRNLFNAVSVSSCHSHALKYTYKDPDTSVLSDWLKTPFCSR